MFIVLPSSWDSDVELYIFELLKKGMSVKHPKQNSKQCSFRCGGVLSRYTACISLCFYAGLKLLFCNFWTYLVEELTSTPDFVSTQCFVDKCFTVMCHRWDRVAPCKPNIVLQFVAALELRVRFREIETDLSSAPVPTPFPLPHHNPVAFLLTVPRRFLCCSSSWIVRRWFYMWRMYSYYCIKSSVALY